MPMMMMGDKGRKDAGLMLSIALTGGGMEEMPVSEHVGGLISDTDLVRAAQEVKATMRGSDEMRFAKALERFIRICWDRYELEEESMGD